MPRKAIPNSRNPHHIAGLMMVDASPRWFFGHTVIEPRRNLEPDSYEMARVAERIGFLARHIEELDLPIIAVESSVIARLCVSDLAGKQVALCGLYGGYCIKEAAGWLRSQAIRVVQVIDAILWPPGIRPAGRTAATLFPSVYFPSWLSKPSSRHS